MVAILLHGVLPGDTKKSTKYSSFVQFTTKGKGDITLKQYAIYSAMSNLNFDICHVHLNKVLTEITAF